MMNSDYPHAVDGRGTPPFARRPIISRPYLVAGIVLIALGIVVRANYGGLADWPEHLGAFCDWLSTTPLSVTIQSALWVVPAVQTAHLLLIATVMGSVFILDLRLLGLVSRDETIVLTMRRFLPAIWTALPLLALTGGVLIVAEPRRELTNPSFGIKMLLLAGVISLTAWFQRRVRIEPSAGNRGAARLVGFVSLLLWIGIVVAGRWIAYTQDS